MPNDYKGCGYGPEYFLEVMEEVSKFLPEIVLDDLPDWVINEGCVEIWSDGFKSEVRDEFRKIARMIENRCERYFDGIYEESSS
jgi:hypothetical protein